MKIYTAFFAVFALTTSTTTAANAQFGGFIKKIEKTIEKSGKQGDGMSVNADGANLKPSGVNTSGGCTAKAPSGPIIGTKLLAEHTPGCPDFVGLSKSPIDPKNLAATQWSKEFKAGDPIYGIIFLEGPLGQFARPGVGDAKEITLNLDAGTEPGSEDGYFAGVFSSSANISVTAENENQHYATFAYIPSPSQPLSSDDTANAYRFLENLKDVKRPVKLYASVKMIGWAVAPGIAPIVIDLTSGTQAYMTMKGGINKGMVKVGGGDQLTMPASAMASPALANRIMAMENGGRDGSGSKVLRVIVTDRDWTPMRHELTGVLIGRVITTTIAYSDREGVCWRQQNTYTEDYNGRTYTNLRHHGMRETMMMACENATK